MNWTSKKGVKMVIRILIAGLCASLIACAEVNGPCPERTAPTGGLENPNADTTAHMECP
jgi:hypothetical protein